MKIKESNREIQPSKKQQSQSDKFDLKPGDLKFFNTNEELEKYIKEKFPDRKIVS